MGREAAARRPRRADRPARRGAGRGHRADGHGAPRSRATRSRAGCSRASGAGWASGIASLANIFELEAVVVGGGLVETGDLLLEPARARRDREYAYAPGGPADRAGRSRRTFGSDAGMVGAALLALEHAETCQRRHLSSTVWVTRCPATSLLGPVLRHVGETTASGLGADRPRRPRCGCSAARRARSRCRATTSRSSPSPAWSPDSRTPYEVHLDGERVWPPPTQPVPAEPDPHPRPGVRRAQPHPLRLLPLREGGRPELAAAARHRRARRLRGPDGAAPARGVARRAAAARRPGLRRRADPAEPAAHRRPPRPAPRLARRRDRRLRRVRRALPRLVVATRRSAG